MLYETGDALAVVRFPWDETGDALAGPRSVWRGGTGTTAGKNSPCIGCLCLDRVSTGIIFSLLASYGLIWMFFAVRGEFCTGCGHAYRVRGEFCAGEGTLRGW